MTIELMVRRLNTPDMNITVWERRNPNLSQNNFSVARSGIIHQDQIATFASAAVRLLVVLTPVLRESEANQFLIRDALSSGPHFRLVFVPILAGGKDGDLDLFLNCVECLDGLRMGRMRTNES